MSQYQNELSIAGRRFWRACEREDARKQREAEAGFAMYECDRCMIRVGRTSGGACVRPATHGRKCRGRMRLA